MLPAPFVVRQVEATAFLRLSAVIEHTGLSRSSIYRLVAANAFPPPVKLGPRAIAWRRTDIDGWSSSRPVSRYGASLAQNNQPTHDPSQRDLRPRPDSIGR